MPNLVLNAYSDLDLVQSMCARPRLRTRQVSHDGPCRWGTRAFEDMLTEHSSVHDVKTPSSSIMPSLLVR